MRKVPGFGFNSLLAFTLFAHANLYAWNGISIRSTPKYQPSNFVHWPYANPNAPQGGHLVLSFLGSFDTLNPYSPKGISPLLLEELVFPQLGESSMNEELTQYPDLGEDFILAVDLLSMRVNIHNDARFFDDKPVTSQDVLFSFNLFNSDHVNPFYKSYWSDIKEVKVISDKSFEFIFDKPNPEIAAIATQIPILPEHFYGKGTFEADYADTCLGAGPYYVAEYKRGSFIRYKKNPRYWAMGQARNLGRYNFDEIMVKYYQDPTAQVEAFKKGEIDALWVNSAKVWARDLSDAELAENGWIEKQIWPHHNNLGAQGYMFNLRQPIFADIRVRKAIALAFDFPWTNKALFYGQYEPNASFFQNSPMQAIGPLAQDEHEILKNLQKTFPQAVPKDCLETPMPHLNANRDMTERLSEANRLLHEAGFQIKNNVMINKDGLELRFRFLLDGSSFIKVSEPFIHNLARLGISASIEVSEEAVYEKKVQSRAFDVIALSIGQSQSPGNEQVAMWSSESADINLSRNYSGLKNPAVDAIVEKIVYAKTRDELVRYTRCLDRLLYSLHLMVHHWHLPYHRVVVWKKFGLPQDYPSYYLPSSFIPFMWLDPNKEDALNKAIKGPFR